MPGPKGRYLPVTGARTFINDLVHFARQVPSVPVARDIDVSALIAPRRAHPAKPAWAILFMRAYALVCAENPPLRRAYVAFPWPRLYEHPYSECALALEREYRGEEAVFVGIYRGPELPSLADLQSALNWYKQTPVEELGFFRQALRISKLPWPLRWFLWWTTLNVSGFKRAKRFGTFGLSSYGSLGAESLHPISPLTTTLTYGPIHPATGQVRVKLVYDHRVLDGAYVARRLHDIETALNGPVLDELKRASTESFLRQGRVYIAPWANEAAAAPPEARAG